MQIVLVLLLPVPVSSSEPLYYHQYLRIMKILKCLPSGEDLNPSNDGSQIWMGIFDCVINGQGQSQRAGHFCAEGFDEIMNMPIDPIV